MYTPRYLENIIVKIHKTFKVLYVGGPRQVGKTTLLLHLSDGISMNHISLDNLGHRRLAQSDPDLFLQQYPAPLFIDEVQYAPNLFAAIKERVDSTQKNGQYWLTGSQQFAIMKNLKESLAGRVGILTLLGFSMAEEEKVPKTKHFFIPGKSLQNIGEPNIRTIFRQIWRGSFPLISSSKRIPLETFYNSYLQTYLDRDLREIFGISKLTPFNDFLRLCAARTGQLFNSADLARDVGVSVPTIREWIRILEASMHIYLLKPYYRNISKRIIKSPKLYFLDTGLAAFLTQWRSPDTLLNGAMAGAFFETFVVSEIIKSYLYRGEQPPLYYFRDKEGHEVDVIIERDGIAYPIEIKISATVNRSDLKNIEYFRKKETRAGKGAILCFAKNRLPIDRNNELIPVTMIT